MEKNPKQRRLAVFRVAFGIMSCLPQKRKTKCVSNKNKKQLRRLVKHLPHTVNMVADGGVDGLVIVEQIN